MLPSPIRRWLLLSAIVALAGATLVSAAPPTASAADPPGTLTSKVLITGAEIHGANGLAIDHDGRLLVASAFGHEIAAVDPLTGKLLEHYGPVVDGVDVGSPDDVAIAPDGSICWTDLGAGFVDCLRPDGGVDSQFVAQGVNPIAFTADGRLFVALAFYGDTLYELDPDLVDPPRVVLAPGGLPPWPEQLNGFDFGPDGLLYAPRPFSGQIGRIDVDAAVPAFEVVSVGPPVGSVEFDPAGNLYASLPVSGEVMRVDIDTGALTLVASLDPNLDNMTIDADGLIYVSNSHDGRVVRLLPSGQARTLTRPGLILPGGIAAVAGDDRADRLFVTDLWSLAAYNGRTGQLESIDYNSHIPPSITTPWTVAPDGDHVIVTSIMANLVQVWDPAANVEVASWPDFAGPVNAIRFGDDLVVAQLGGVPVPCPGPSGVCTGSVVRQTPGGDRTTIASGLFLPTGLAATGDDLWVADWASGIVWRIVTDGTPTMVPVATGLANPEGLALDRDGSLLAVESGAGRLTRILPSGAKVTMADGLPMGAPAEAGFPPEWIFNGVAVGPSGAIYVTSDVLDVVWRFTEVPR